MNRLTMNICPICGQITFGLMTAGEAVCPFCRNVWKLYPRDKIEVRLSV
jgi:uncharacterized Zn finger protein (UPF0148 family)